MAGMKILGWGSAHGDREVTNRDMMEYVETSDEWIRSKTGIGQRFFAEQVRNADMATAAAREALSKVAERTPLKVTDSRQRAENLCDERACATDSIDVLIVATFTPDRATPSMAAEVAGNLGISGRVLTLDLNSACSGFVYGLVVANALLQTGYRRVLLIASEKIHPLMDMTDRRTCVLFGDAAGAVILERDADGEFFHLEGVEPNLEILQCDRFNPAIRMAGQEVYRFAVSAIPTCSEKLLEQAECTVDDVDMFIFHQANRRIIDSAARKLQIPEVKCFLNVEKYGNTSAASIAVALSECLDQKKIEEGSRIVMVGFGAGLSYGGVLMTI